MSAFRSAGNRSAGNRGTGNRGTGDRVPVLARLARMASAGLKEFGVSVNSDYGWTVRGGRWHSAFYPGSDVDWAKEAGTLWHNGAVGLCVNYLFNKVVEPAAQVVADGPDDTLVPAPKHPLLTLLRRPNPEYRGSALVRAAALSYKVNGNAYIIKVRDAGGHGAVRELWYLPHWQMEPAEPKDGGPTEFYRHVVGNREKLYPRRDVIHLKFGIDPESPRRGLSPFRAQFQSVASDREIDTYTATILRNMGVIGALVSPANKEDEITPTVAEQIKAKMLSQSTGDMRGGVAFPSIPVKVDRVGTSPQEMALDSIGNRPESRICATFGFEPMAIGLPSGNTTYANKSEARAASYENGIVPMLSEFAEAFTEELLLSEYPREAGDRVVFNYDKVRDLQPDVNARDRRARENFTRGIWKLSRAQETTGIKPDPDVDGYAWQLMPQKVAASAAEGSDGGGAGNG